MLASNSYCYSTSKLLNQWECGYDIKSDNKFQPECNMVANHWFVYDMFICLNVPFTNI